MRIIITVFLLRKYLPIVTIEIKVIIEIALIEPLNNQKETIIIRKIIGLPFRIIIKHLPTLDMTSKTLLITKNRPNATNSQQEETKKMEESSSISVQQLNF